MTGMRKKLEISASYAATDGSMPESVNVTFEADDAADVDVACVITILELFLSAPAQRRDWRRGAP